MTKYVYDFSEGNRELASLLGGKGANLAEMTGLGLPVPPGFTITTEACQTFLTHGAEPRDLSREVDEHLAGLERTVGRTLGQHDDPLLVDPHLVGLAEIGPISLVHRRDQRGQLVEHGLRNSTPTLTRQRDSRLRRPH